jgi:hypothetical protein
MIQTLAIIFALAAGCVVGCESGAIGEKAKSTVLLQN